MPIFGFEVISDYLMDQLQNAIRKAAVLQELKSSTSRAMQTHDTELCGHLQTKDLRGNPKPWVSRDRTKTSPGLRTFSRIFSAGSGNFILSQSEPGYFFIGVRDIFTGFGGDKLTP